MRFRVLALVVGVVLSGVSLGGCAPRGGTFAGAAKATTEAGDTGGSGSRRETAPPGGAWPPVAWSEGMARVADGADRYALEQYRLLADGAGDLVFSPFSIHAALAMTACGARGATLAQVRSALHLPDDDRLGDAGDLVRYYGSGDRPYDLAVASALWGQEGVAWQPDFLALLADRFSAGFREADFANDPDGGRQSVNAWVSERTSNRIPSLLAPGTITPLTRIVLANAIFFKGRWAGEFDPARTTMEPFHRADSRVVTVPLMHRKGRERHLAGEGFQLLTLPYIGGDLEMAILLPSSADGLPALETRLTPEALGEWTRTAEPVEVDIRLPRFRIEATSGTNMNGTLRTLGITDIFDPGACDLSGMTTTEKLVVSAVIHQAFVEVNEEGTEAAAATAVVGNAPGPPPPKPVEFRADRPFLFMIRDAAHGTILFMGRLASGGGAA